MEKTQDFLCASYYRALSKMRASRPAFGPELGAHLAHCGRKTPASCTSGAQREPARSYTARLFSTGTPDFHMQTTPKNVEPDLTIMKKVLYFPIVRGARVGVLPCRRPAICLIVNEVRLVTNTG